MSLPFDKNFAALIGLHTDGVTPITATEIAADLS